MTRTTATLAGVFVGMIAVFAALFFPAGELNALVEATGLASLIPQASPPLGMTARLLAGGLGLVLCTAIGWAVGRLLEPAAPLAESAEEMALPVEPVPAAVPALDTSAPAPDVPAPSLHVPATALRGPLDPPAPQVHAPAETMARRTTSPGADAPIARSAARAAPVADMSEVLERIDTLETRVAGQLAHMTQQLAEIAATTRTLARTPQMAAMGTPPRLSRRIGLDGETRRRVAETASALRASLGGPDRR